MNAGLVLTAAALACAPPVNSQPLEITTCAQHTLTRPGFGVSYKGKVRNDDYRFSATIPGNFMGWGAAPTAPFHGFVVFLDSGSKLESCIDLYIGRGVEIEEDHANTDARQAQVRTAIGNRLGQRIVTTGLVGGTAYENTHVSLELPRHGYTNVLEVMLLAPAGASLATKATFDRFLKSFHFW
jgi:hypothetical protein